MAVQFDGLNMDDVSSIEFVFKKANSKYAEALKTSVYNSDGSGDAIRRIGESIIDVPWTPEDTYKFPENELVYMDTRITMSNSFDNPMTPISSFPMCNTLFEETT